MPDRLLLCRSSFTVMQRWVSSGFRGSCSYGVPTVMGDLADCSERSEFKCKSIYSLLWMVNSDLCMTLTDRGRWLMGSTSKRQSVLGSHAHVFCVMVLQISIVKVNAQLGSVTLGKQMHCCTLKHGLETHVFVRNTLIHMYGLLGYIETACELFGEMPRPNVVAWNTIIDCHVHCGRHRQALEMFLRMLRSNMKPDDATLVVTLAACSALGALEFGGWIQSLISHASLFNTVSVCNALIDMYAKCGAVEDAYNTFSRMTQRNIVSWNSMILGLALHGHIHEALVLFSKLLEEELELPNDITFLGVLCACSHGGMVEEGRRYFDSMRKDYNIQPTIKHYGCMVDILGRSGLVHEAYELIRDMPMECNAIVWRTLLSCCRLHGNVELGEKVRNHLLNLEPDHSSDYVLLSNMYASMGQWDNMARVRKSMRETGVRKPEPGNSCVGVYHNLTQRPWYRETFSIGKAP